MTWRYDLAMTGGHDLAMTGRHDLAMTGRHDLGMTGVSEDYVQAEGVCAGARPHYVVYACFRHNFRIHA